MCYYIYLFKQKKKIFQYLLASDQEIRIDKKKKKYI